MARQKQLCPPEIRSTLITDHICLEGMTRVGEKVSRHSVLNELISGAAGPPPLFKLSGRVGISIQKQNAIRDKACCF